ncbi:MAG: VOC family protein [Candidatus Omnitrophota bacterium]|jgi:glyoxylase I family protein
MKLGHIALSISDLGATVEFYRRNFGFELAEEYTMRSSGLKICILKKGNIALEVFEFEDHQALPQYRKNLDSDLRTIGVKHCSFEVDNIQAAYDRLKKSAVEFAGDICTFEDGRRYFFIRDPDGILIEIMEEEKK